MMKWMLFAVVLMAITIIEPASACAGTSLPCGIPTTAVTPSESLAHVRAAMTERHTVNILALGSASTVGQFPTSSGPNPTAPSLGNSFPMRMLDALRGMRRNVAFHLDVNGRRGMMAGEMLTILRTQLAAHHYDLVLWQTGTVEAVHGVRPELLQEALEDGAAAVDDAHADLVLIDPQFSRFLRANIDIFPYESVLEQATSYPGVTLFHRMDLTEDWVTNEQVDLERASQKDRDKTIRILNACLGEALARYVLNGAAEP